MNFSQLSRLRPSPRTGLISLSLSLVATLSACAAHPTPPDNTPVYADDVAQGAEPIAVEKVSVASPEATAVEPTAMDASPEKTPQGDASEEEPPASQDAAAKPSEEEATNATSTEATPAADSKDKAQPAPTETKPTDAKPAPVK